MNGSRSWRVLAASAVLAVSSLAVGNGAGAAPVQPTSAAEADGCATYRVRTSLPLRQCDSGALVRDIQALINPWLPVRIDVDGKYGAETALAVREFQRRFGLSVDGLAGSQTFAAARARAGRCPKYRTSSTFPLTNCDQGLVVLYAQNMLNWAMPDRPFPVGGHFGANTYAAVREFQRRMGFSVDGIISQRTYAGLVYLAVINGHLP